MASSPGDDGGALTFHEATHLSGDDVHRLQRTLQRRVLRLFQRRGLLDESTIPDMLTWQAAGGFSLDASVRIHGSDATGRERLLRYCAGRPSPSSACTSSNPPTGTPSPAASRGRHPPGPPPPGAAGRFGESVP